MTLYSTIPIDKAHSINIRHHSIKNSLYSLWEQYLYGDGWRLVEIVIASWVIVRGISILFAGGMDASYYANFPYHQDTLLWGLAALSIGFGRLAGTIINGKWQRSPRLRWTAGVGGACYQGLHCYFFYTSGYALLAIGYFFWMAIESMGVIRSSIDIMRKRESKCRNGL